ncbi:pseudouridine synthase [Patiriisocius marinus]|uniref:Pseudouridine synthase n=1 Tax=Patiriisocius marinus TaxID=1397112 RepID=A0A5J4J395_9FLAO|nr:RluA family pseudouridine synthase [Patiriisocius marinus]GER60271.1 pseudouridine synthase [Patiriisocius marinus]
MVLQEKHILKSFDTPTRLSDLPVGTFVTIQSRKAFKKALKKALVKLNGEPAQTSNFVLGGELIEIFTDESIKKKPKISIPFEILFEDEYIAIINKPAGVEVSGNKKYTITNALSSALKSSNQVDALIRPLPAHRLDYPTSGCLIIGKTSKALTVLNQQFEHQQVDKTYIAVTVNSQTTQGIIKEPIDKKPSTSSYQVLKTIASQKYGALNLVALKPHTGRRHQLRKHLAYIGNPIFGEKEYGNPSNQGHGNGLYLQAYKLEFNHPITNELVLITSPVSKKFKNLFVDIQQTLLEINDF